MAFDAVSVYRKLGVVNSGFSLVLVDFSSLRRTPVRRCAEDSPGAPEFFILHSSASLRRGLRPYILAVPA
jgi:hypothetical protein